MSWPRAALLSLSDKSGAAEFARALADGGSTLLASGGTAKHLEEAGLTVTPVEQLTGFSELLGGRVKTLHPHVHAPILARRGVAEDMAELAGRALPAIDLVAVSLYPFEHRAAALDEPAALEEIDIGGVALLRAAAKNWSDVIVVHDPAQYAEVLEALRAGSDDAARRRAWARSAFLRTARYDAAIAADLGRRAKGGLLLSSESMVPPETYVLPLERVRTLRYGENPDQPAALYARTDEYVQGSDASRGFDAVREGKELSYNNLLDIEAAAELAWAFDPDAACVIVKHTQPCGAACAGTLEDAYTAALHSDELSAFGGVVAFNRPLDAGTASRVAKQFVECVVAPGFSEEAADLLSHKKNLRLVRVGVAGFGRMDPWQVRLLGPWALLLRNTIFPAPPPWRVVTKRAPTAAEERALRFAWEIVAAARSNAITIARGTQLVGLGSGQTSRVDAVDVAILKARRAGHDLAGTSLASDGFFPFADNIEHAAEAGVTAIVQPGGSVRDADVIGACDARGLAMMFTDRRTFRH